MVGYRPRRSAHPSHSHSLRWIIATTPAWILIVGFIGFIISYAIVLAVSRLLLLGHAGPGLTPRSIARSVMEAVPPILGIGDFPIDGGGLGQLALAMVASIPSALIPAIIIGVVLVRIFTVKPFRWRQAISAVQVVELDLDIRRVILDSNQVFLAVRWYKSPRQLTISDLTAEAFLNYRTPSRIDGSIVHRTERLRVLDSEAHEADCREWPRMRTGMPFTLWIPTHSDLVDGSLARLQGREIGEHRSPGILVRLKGKATGFAADVVDERWYSLEHDLQRGRFVPINPVVPAPHGKVFLPRLELSASEWSGWNRFEQTARYAVFVYGSLMHPDALKNFCGSQAKLGSDYFRASLTDWTRKWTVCTDNTVAENRVAYHDPVSGDRVSAQILFLNVEPVEGESVSGVLVPVTVEQLHELDEREGNYDRINVTRNVPLSLIPETRRPDTVWVYTGKEVSNKAAKRGIASQTAVIWNTYLKRVVAALECYEGFLDEFNKESLPVPRDCILALNRRAADGSVTDPYGRVGKQVGQ